jgi:hypothetical protein
MIERGWRREQPGEYVYVVGGKVAGAVYRDTQGRWQWYAERWAMPSRTPTNTGDPFARLDSAKAAVVRALGGAS